MSHQIRGTNHRDYLLRTEGDDQIGGRDGDDEIYGLGGDDRIRGDNDNDYIVASEEKSDPLMKTNTPVFPLP